jgi:hypothetical protein
VVLGACELADQKSYDTWLPFFEMLEAGCWCVWFGDKEAIWMRIPKVKTEQFNAQRRLHADGMPALELPNERLYFLHGVMVPEELAMTPAENLSLSFMQKEKNADVKAEFIRKFGIERMKQMGRIVDSFQKYDNEWFKKSEYELVDMSPVFTRLTYAPYLSMKNQSVPGVFHMEAVEFRTKTKNPMIVNIK